MIVGLVDLFGNFVRETYVVPVAFDGSAISFPDDLHDLREAVGHHLIPLLLLARTDRDFAESERDVIVDHCIGFARQQGVACDDNHVAALRDYAVSFRPTLMQLDPALTRLSHSDHGEFSALVDAAQALVSADGVSRPEEVKFLARLRDELDKLPATPVS